MNSQQELQAPAAAEATAIRQWVSVVIPAYNEVGAIGSTLVQLQAMMAGAGLAGEIIVVDDGSSDGTAGEVARYPAVRLVRHVANKGYGAALKTGIRQACYDTVVIVDADGTYPIEMIPRLAAEIGPYDMAVGARTGESVNVPLRRRPAKWALNRLANYLSGLPIPDLNSGLRAFKRDVVLSFFRLLPSGFSFTTSLTLAMLTNDYNVVYLPVNYHHRTGQSKIRPIRDTINFFSLVVRMVLSFRPLRVFIPVASVFLFLSAIKVTYDINAYDFHLATSTVVLLTLTFQMIVLGLIADLVVSLHKQ
ncbi:MAG: glycosyltransferase family 2 protein [Chloroflexi bacterium]|nr:glycosyltransferase family 2 protein [Chloroflexota bacterium]MCI0579645.1 glycosyltransferase family 2 protein [Chloroflexota bacterium]MCI0644381.1 glycosyltransferase family 2 protein [Chloroflexota bacterium]MCI0727366.1 glycosyltransferase family 2 protein [Chloroflexota bacterium]